MEQVCSSNCSEILGTTKFGDRSNTLVASHNTARIHGVGQIASEPFRDLKGIAKAVNTILLSNYFTIQLFGWLVSLFFSSCHGYRKKLENITSTGSNLIK